jgi:hypothetical protein
MLPLEIAHLLSQCTLVADSARIHDGSATESAEQLPPLRAYKKAKRTKSNRRSTTGVRQPNLAQSDRWTAEVKVVQPIQTGHLTRASATSSNTAPLHYSNDLDVSPRLVAPRRLPSSDGLCMDMMIISPKGPSRQKPSLNAMLAMSPRIYDMSPRKPERRPHIESKANTTAAQLLREALSIIDLSE